MSGLIAFWEYDQYPFCLHGPAVEVDEKGLVKVSNYGGAWFKPFVILPENVAQPIINKLDSLSEKYENESREILERYKEKAFQAMPYLPK